MCTVASQVGFASSGSITLAVRGDTAALVQAVAGLDFDPLEVTLISHPSALAHPLVVLIAFQLEVVAILLHLDQVLALGLELGQLVVAIQVLGLLVQQHSLASLLRLNPPLVIRHSYSFFIINYGYIH